MRTYETLLESCRKLAEKGDFVQLGNNVQKWIEKSKDNGVREKIPPIILNSYLVKQNILNFSEFRTWQLDSNWAEAIKRSCDNGDKLSSVVNSTIQSMNEFKNA